MYIHIDCDTECSKCGHKVVTQKLTTTDLTETITYDASNKKPIKY